MTNFNINDEALVKLTPLGRRVYREHMGFDCPPPDERGYNGFQFWVLMSIYGPKLHMGMTEMPFEGNKILVGGDK